MGTSRSKKVGWIECAFLQYSIYWLSLIITCDGWTVVEVVYEQVNIQCGTHQYDFKVGVSLGTVT